MRTGPILLTLLLAPCATATRSVEVGVAFDRGHEIASFADGIADPRAHRAVTPDDAARVASVSKLVVAIGVIKLVEQGRLDLDHDVSRWLGWKLRNPGFPDQPISMRQLLSHTSSVRDHDDQYAIPLGHSVSEALADTHSWDPEHGPAAHYFAYSNMNFPIVASIIERVTGERFDIWMRHEVLEPMKLDACYNWATCSDAAVARAVELDGPDGKPQKDDLHGKRPECPVLVDDGKACDLSGWKAGENGALFAPQGGLRISARGLARVGRMLLNRGMLDGVRILSPRSVESLLKAEWRFDGRNGARDGESTTICSYGLATQQIPTGGCAADPGTDGAPLVGHAGDAYGLRSGLWIDRKRGRGIAYFVTGVPDDPLERSAFSPAETHAFRRAYALLPR